MNWRSTSRVLCDHRILIQLEGNFYHTTIQPAMLYGTECWIVKKQHIHKISVIEMRILRWISGNT